MWVSGIFGSSWNGETVFAFIKTYSSGNPPNTGRFPRSVAKTNDKYQLYVTERIFSHNKLLRGRQFKAGGSDSVSILSVSVPHADLLSNGLRWTQPAHLGSKQEERGKTVPTVSFSPLIRKAKAFPETLHHLRCLLDQNCVMNPTRETMEGLAASSPKVRFCNNKKGTDGDRTMNTVSSDEH